ncbi:MAG: beta-ketoacyl-[acyl-carrier-protein] synthase II [Omnitrophica bacterium RIFCSPHIGHO2_02_FULL_46_11]|nr:MAG: beta-ketoacyl-[acyl-carrier-protein] synthase II [Omnitrophica bacterium RIFCSPHIGHO2_02_FULL_46_11]
MNRHRVVITGMGVLAPNGKTIDEFWKALVSGISGVNSITAFDATDYEVKVAAEVKNFDPANYVLPGIYRKMDRFAQLGVCAAKMAIDDADLSINSTNDTRIGVVIGTGLGGLLFHEEQIINVIRDGGPSKAMASSVPRISPNSVSSYIGIAFGIKGPNYAVSTACSSGANAIGQGLLMLRSGMIDVCIVGGVEAPITPVTVAAYQNLRCLSVRNGVPSEVSKPFDKKRDGFVIGEGAGVLVLETLEHAEKRKVKIHAELLGYGTNCGAYSMVAPQPEGLDAAQAINDALKDAEISTDSVDYINAHGTGTVYNDLAETKAIKHVFGKRAYQIPISSTKSIIGHTIGAAGAIAAIVCVLSLEHQEIHPTINLKNPDPDCDLDYVPGCRRRSKINTVVSNSFGFGSNNAVLTIRRYER